MKSFPAISLTQPWASLMVKPGPERKEYETRSWTTRYRGMLAIAASKGFPGWAKELASEEIALDRLVSPLPLAAIVGVVRLVGVYRTEELDLSITTLERRYGDYTHGRYAWRTELVATFADPIACRGALGLWTPPPEVMEAILAQIAAEVPR